ncbi:MAG: hypothetical protein R2813_02800 [Flavobacteriales bacterium]
MFRRLRIYFTGFGIGLIIVVIMFWRDDSRDMDIWTPEQRILEDIRLDSIFLDGKTLHCYQECLGLTDDQLSSLWTNSKTKSLNPGGNPYIYLISLSEDELRLEAEIEWDKKRRKLLAMRDMTNPKSCSCE